MADQSSPGQSLRGRSLKDRCRPAAGRSRESQAGRPFPVARRGSLPALPDRRRLAQGSLLLTMLLLPENRPSGLRPFPCAEKKKKEKNLPSRHRRCPVATTGCRLRWLPSPLASREGMARSSLQRAGERTCFRGSHFFPLRDFHLEQRRMVAGRLRNWRRNLRAE
jgi:hypothetical protein